MHCICRLADPVVSDTRKRDQNLRKSLSMKYKWVNVFNKSIFQVLTKGKSWKMREVLLSQKTMHRSRGVVEINIAVVSVEIEVV